MKERVNGNQHQPIFLYMTETPSGPIACHENFLVSRLPIDRPDCAQQKTSPITLKAYFEAIEEFLRRNLENVQDAAAEISGVRTPEIDVIKIVADKHGSDYHPARVIVECGEVIVSLAVNAAVSNRGRKRICSEWSALRYITAGFDRRFVPRVFFTGVESMFMEDARTIPVSMLTVEWFENFHEFHLWRDPTDGLIHASVWEPHPAADNLTERELAEIYRQAAYILTYYYDVETHSEIFPWHHAAGDFVVSRNGNQIDLKLITVRQYTARIVLEEPTLAGVRLALLMFLVNLTLRMRLDRHNGTGAILWAPSHSVSATISGYCRALEDQATEGRITPRFFHEVIQFLRDLPPKELTVAFLSAIDSYNADAPDTPVILEHIEDHIFSVFKALKRL